MWTGMPNVNVCCTLNTEGEKTMVLALIIAGVSLILALLANNRANYLKEESEDVKDVAETGGGVMATTLELMLAQYERGVRTWRVFAGALALLCVAELVIALVMFLSHVF